MKRPKQNSRTVTRRRPFAAPYVNATTFVPVVVPLELPGLPLPFDMQEWRTAVNELRAPPNLVFVSDELEIRRLAVTELKGAESNKFRITHRIGYIVGVKPFWDVAVIAYSAQAKLKRLYVERRYSKEELNVIHEQLVAEAFARMIRRWLVASLLAKTGIVQFSDILVTSNDKLWHRHEDFHGLSSEHLEVAQRMKWPPIQTLSISLVWEWLQKVPGLNNDFGVNEVGRALAAFTHLLRPRDPTTVGEVLLWALLGLEACTPEERQNWVHSSR